MTVRTKTLLTTGATLFALIGLVCTSSILILMDDCNRHETDLVRENLMRMSAALANEFSYLDTTVGDYAGRDDTYQFVEDKNEEYKRNYHDDTLVRQRLSFVALYDRQANLVYGKGFDPVEEIEAPLPGPLKSGLAADDLLLHHRDEGSSVNGLVVLDGRIYAVASRPVLTSEYKGPTRGAVVFGRAFDRAKVRELGASTMLSLTAFRVDDSELPDDFRKALPALLEKPSGCIRLLSDDSIAGYELLRDIYGRPAVILRMDAPRDYRRQFFASLRYFFYSTVAVALALGGISLFIMERTLLGRLGRLSRFVKGVRADKVLSSRLDMPGGDELSQLTVAVNDMLAALEHDALARERAQRAIAESEAKHRAVFNTASDAILLVDRETGEIRDVNDAALHLYGYTREELLSLKNTDISNEPAETRRALREMLTYVPLRYHKKKDGTVFPVEFTAGSMQLDGRAMTIVVIRDITERRKVEDALDSERNLLRTLVDILPDSVYATDSEGRRILANRFYLEMTGKPAEEVVGKTDLEVYSPSVAEAFWRDTKSVLTTGNPIIDKDEPMAGPDGRRWVLTSKVPLRDGDGRIVGLVGVGHDITERKIAEEALALERNLLRTLIDSLPDVIYVKDSEGRKLVSNTADLSLMGVKSMEEAIGKTDFDFYPHELASEWRSHDEQVMRGGKPYMSEHVQTVAGSPTRYLLITKVPLRDAEGNISGLVGVNRDVTQLRTAIEAVRASEKKYRQLVELAQEGILALDEKGNVTFANPRLVAMLGYEAGEMLAKPVFDFVSPAGAEDAFARLERRGEGLTDAYETVMVRRDGGQIAVSVAAAPITEPDGTYVGSIAVIADITERKRAEEALRESETRYRSLFTSMTSACALSEITSDSSGTPDGYRFLDVNPSWEKTVGLSRRHVIGKTFAEVHHKIDPDWLAEFSRVALNGSDVHFEKYSAALDKHLEVTAYCPKPGQFAVLFTDVTERHKAEEEIRRLRAQIEFILGATKTGIDIIDQEFNVRYVDPEWRKIYGDPAGQKCYRYFRGEDVPCKYCGVKAAFETKQATITELTLPKENNRPVHVTSVPYQDSNGEWLVAEVSVDISDRKRLEEQLLQAQKMEAIGQLAGGVAHDFNNLLTGILGYANMLKLDTTPGTPVHDAAGTIERAAERAAELTKQLLGFARRGKYLRMPVDVNSIGQEVIRLLSRTVEKSVSLTQRFAVRTPWVIGDPDQIQQAVLNLAVNARDAMPDGGELVIETRAVDVDQRYCSTVRDAVPGRYAKISVVDTGIGISAEDKQHIFEPFFTTKAHGKGTGMGLAMVYGIVKNHNGFVQVYSEVAHGSRFDMYLPLADVGAEGLTHETGALVKGTGRILLVDDEDIVRDVAADMLRALGYEVVTATSGDNAVEYFREHWDRIDLVIIDLVMPGLGARECFIELKKMNPDLRAVLSSGYGLNGKAQETVDEGMLGFVQKPYTMSELSAVVRNAMQRP